MPCLPILTKNGNEPTREFTIWKLKLQRQHEVHGYTILHRTLDITDRHSYIRNTESDMICFWELCWGKHWIMQVCWFCKKRPAHYKSRLEVYLYKVVGVHSTALYPVAGIKKIRFRPTTVIIPRCPKCVSLQWWCDFVNYIVITPMMLAASVIAGGTVPVKVGTSVLAVMCIRHHLSIVEQELRAVRVSCWQ